jgi:hypothetical protein
VIEMSESEKLGTQKNKGNPRFTEGEGWLAWKRVPLKVKGSVIDREILENHENRKRSSGMWTK